MSGNARGPSSAFCLLYRLGQLKPTPPQIRMMLDHKDSPYIRAVGPTRRGALRVLGAGGRGLLRRAPCLRQGTCTCFVGCRASAHRHILHPEPPALRTPRWLTVLPAACPLCCRWVSCTCATCATRASCGPGAGNMRRTRRWVQRCAAGHSTSGGPGGGGEGRAADGVAHTACTRRERSWLCLQGCGSPAGGLALALGVYSRACITHTLKLLHPRPTALGVAAAVLKHAAPTPPLQEFTPSPAGMGKQITMGDFVRDILLDQVRATSLGPSLIGRGGLLCGLLWGERMQSEAGRAGGARPHTPTSYAEWQVAVRRPVLLGGRAGAAPVKPLSGGAALLAGCLQLCSRPRPRPHPRPCPPPPCVQVCCAPAHALLPATPCCPA